MLPLAIKLKIPYQRLVIWARDGKHPDFRDSKIISRMRPLERRFFQHSGQTLAEIFYPPKPEPPSIPLESLADKEPSYEIGPVLELAVDLRRIINELKPEDRELIRWAAEGWSHEELANWYGVKRQAIQQKLSRIREHIARRLNGRRR